MERTGALTTLSRLVRVVTQLCASLLERIHCLSLTLLTLIARSPDIVTVCVGACCTHVEEALLVALEFLVLGLEQ